MTFGGHCGQQIQCPGRCVCGEAVKADPPMAPENSQQLPVAPPRVVVALGAVRSLLGRNGSIKCTEETA